MRQISLFKNKKHSKRKTARVVSVQQFNHIVLKSKIPVLRKNHALIKTLIQEAQKRFSVKIKAIAIMEDHLHFVLLVSSREQFANFLRFLAGMIALKLKRGKLWKQVAWSRIVKAGRDYRIAANYVWNNPSKARITACEIDSYILINGALVEDLVAWAQQHCSAQPKSQLGLFDLL